MLPPPETLYIILPLTDRVVYTEPAITLKLYIMSLGASNSLLWLSSNVIIKIF